MSGVKAHPLHPIDKNERRQSLAIRGDQILRSQRKFANGAERFQQLAQSYELFGCRWQQFDVTVFQAIRDRHRLADLASRRKAAGFEKPVGRASQGGDHHEGLS